uniref:RanBP2-type domain-containing protein n=1 Tax=Megaselia scalaris TaxID=36166 RepID=T1GWG4_MEGSC
MNTSGKWSCEYCTYENFQSSQKCVMCKGLRPTVNEDIFRVNSPVNITEQNFYNSDKYALFSDPNESSDGPNSSIVQEKSCHFENQNSVNIKWSCSVCTYFNWPKSKYCIQCLTVRKVKKSQQSDDSKNSISFGKSENEVQSSTEDTISNLGQIIFLKIC